MLNAELHFSPCLGALVGEFGIGQSPAIGEELASRRPSEDEFNIHAKAQRHKGNAAKGRPEINVP
jgi:hypothetical protein